MLLLEVLKVIISIGIAEMLASQKIVLADSKNFENNIADHEILER
jgi:hypothetical protein